MSLRASQRGLMDQCSNRHDTPRALNRQPETSWPGHDLPLELKAQSETVLTNQRLPTSISETKTPVEPH